MEILIKKYLEKNNKNAVNMIDYSLKNIGKGDFIDFWNEKSIGLSKPIFTEEELKSIPLLEAQAQKINEIGQAKEEALYAPIAYLNTSFSASERACQNMLGNLVLNGETVEWQELNKKPIIMTRAQFQTLAVLVKNQRNASYFKEGELMKKIALAKTPEELKNIKW